MKASTALRKALDHIEKSESLMRPISSHLAEVLEDDCAHVTHSPGDNLVIAWEGGMNNSSIDFSDIDKMMKMNKEKLLEELNRTGI